MARRNGRRLRRRGRKNMRRKFKSFAKRVNKAVRYQAEKKQFFYNTGAAGVSIQTGGDSIFQLLTGVTGGSGSDQRIGNKIRGRYVKIQGFMYSGSIASFIRLSVVRGRTNGLTVGDAPTNDQWTYWDKDKFDVIYDKLLTLSEDPSSGRDIRPFKITIRCMKEMLYDTSEPETQTTNPYYFFVTGNDALIPSPIIYYSYVFSYTDI